MHGVFSYFLEMNSDSVAMTELHGKMQEQETVCIFGTGDFGRSLGLRLLQSGYNVVYGSRDPKNSLLLPKGSKVMAHAAAACEAHVIFVAVQREHYGFLKSLASTLAGKVLIDVSNNLRRGLYPESNAEYLSSLVPGATVVKAFNTISAWALQSGGLDANRQVKHKHINTQCLSSQLDRILTGNGNLILTVPFHSFDFK